MTIKETYLSRGTTEEGKEVVGYYYYDKYEEKNKMIVQEHFEEEGEYPEHPRIRIELNTYEITSPPQKCLGIRDCEGELIFEGDVGLYGSYKEPEKVCFGEYDVYYQEHTWENYGFYLDDMSGCLMSFREISPRELEGKFKIIHNTTKEK